MNYEVSLQTISWLHNQRSNERLEISPKFQRRAVWMEKERSELISTILLGLPFPEIYVQVVTDPDTGAQSHRVVDGQQRVTSILMFIDGQVSLPVDDDFAGQYFTDLEVDTKEAFWDYKVVVRSLRQTNDSEIRDLFARLNTNNITLNDQEIRNARYRGRFKQLSERLADNPLFEKMGLFTARDIRRMRDVEYASELIVLTMYGITNKKDLIDDAYINHDEELPNEAEYESEFTSTLQMIWSIYDPTAKAAYKTFGNFYTLFGVVLEYARETGSPTFSSPPSVKQAVSDFLKAVRAKDFPDDDDSIERYQDAVSRASTDKGRRETRHKILLEVIRNADK